MIIKDYKTKVSMDAEKLAILKEKFKGFFGPEKTPVQIHVHESHFYTVEKSMNSANIDPNRGNMVRMKAAPAEEGYQMQWNVWDNNEQVHIAFSRTLPKSMDNVGHKFEYEWNSGNMFDIKHGKTLYPDNAGDDEILYCLYFYAPIFSNGAAANKDSDAKYFFFIEEDMQRSRKTKAINEYKIIGKIQALSNKQMEAVISRLGRKPSSVEETNFNLLFDLYKSADSNTEKTLDEAIASVGSDFVKVETTGTELRIDEQVTLWIQNEKLKAVTEVSEEFPKIGWYQKPSDADVNADQTKFLKTPIQGVNIDPDIDDQRFILIDYLNANPSVYQKLKTRWK